jgi:hypothetical protein
MSFQIHTATREGVKPLIVPYSESGCGKTYSALLLARGLAGPDGKIVVGDSESRRASLYADVIPGGFDTFDITDPFSPERYIEAVDTIEQSGAAVGIIDSGSHEWEGIGGVLDLQAMQEEKSGKPGLHNWKGPLFEHAKFVQRLLSAKLPLIICLRGKYKTRQGKDERGKTVIVKDDHLSPIQREDFIFEATVHFVINQDHSIVMTKCSHPGLGGCFPENGKGPITIEHGGALARWCAAPGGPGTKPIVNGDPRKSLLRELWNLTKQCRSPDDKTWSKFEDWAMKHTVMGEGDPPILEMSIEQLSFVLGQTREILK